VARASLADWGRFLLRLVLLLLLLLLPLLLLQG
jgi:hypothetical protein